MHGCMTLRARPVVRRPRLPKPKLYVGPWLRRLGMKQVEIAREVGVGESHMALIVKGDRYPSPGLLSAIAIAMGVTEMDLRRPPPDEAVIRAAAGISPETLARLGQNLKKPG